jgi:hypothetical protein
LEEGMEQLSRKLSFTAKYGKSIYGAAFAVISLPTR